MHSLSPIIAKHLLFFQIRHIRVKSQLPADSRRDKKEDLFITHFQKNKTTNINKPLLTEASLKHP